jgi:hypothetical protein
MTLYLVHFVDWGGHVYAAREVEHESDAAAIGKAHALNVIPMHGTAFEVWQDERLVHRHQNISPYQEGDDADGTECRSSLKRYEFAQFSD